MDHQRDSDWIEPLEATALSADEEAESQTPVSIEGDMNRTGTGVDFPSMSAGGDAGAPLWGGYGGVSYDSPPELLTGCGKLLTTKRRVPKNCDFRLCK